MSAPTHRDRTLALCIPCSRTVSPTLAAAALLAALLILGSTRAVPAAPGDPVDPGQGALVGRDAAGRTVDFPLKHTDVQIEVSGFLARAQVTQEFTNPYDRRIEAVYVFPLPENAAVDDMVLKVGARTIRGVIRERNEARKVYEQARANGQTAALLEQERPNLFTQSVANLLPGDDVKITITYVQTLKYEAGTLSLSFPMVVGPRYIPGHVTTPEGDAIPVGPDACKVPDADRITPPVLRPGTRSGHDIAVSVRLDAGVPYTDLRSKSHAIEERRTGPNVAEVRLADGDSIPNRDFVLEWDVRPERVAAGVLAHRTQGDGFVTLMLVPSPSPKAADVTPKEMVFVLDCSGSMSGAPIEAAKSLVRHALARLNPDDTFQILSFSMSASGMAPTPLRNTPGNVARGLAYLETLQGEGGTEMITGIRAALSPDRDPRRMRVVLFLTDGYIGNETEILSAVRDRVGEARLYSLGVGSAVNRYLLENLALEGRGQVLYITPQEDPAPAVARFYDQVRSPVLTDVAIDWNGLEVDQAYPARPSDLFAGHPLLVTARYHRAGEATVRVTGRVAGERVSIPLKLSLPDREAENPALRSLWARQAIEERMRKMLQGEIPEVVKEVIGLSVGNRVLSQYTAFVAVEEKARTNERGDPVKVEVPVELPQDVSFEGVYGEESDGDSIVSSFSAADRGAMRMRQAPARMAERRSYGFGAMASGPAPSSLPPAPPSAAAAYGAASTGVGKAKAGAGSTGSVSAFGSAGGSAPGGLAGAQAGAARSPEAKVATRSDAPALPAIEIRRSKGLPSAFAHAAKSQVFVALKSLAADLAGTTAVVRIAMDTRNGLHAVAIEGLDAQPAKRDRILKALRAAGIWHPGAANGATGTAELVVTF